MLTLITGCFIPARWIENVLVQLAMTAGQNLSIRPVVALELAGMVHGAKIHGLLLCVREVCGRSNSDAQSLGWKKGMGECGLEGLLRLKVVAIRRAFRTGLHNGNERTSHPKLPSPRPT